VQVDCSSGSRLREKTNRARGPASRPRRGRELPLLQEQARHLARLEARCAQM